MLYLTKIRNAESEFTGNEQKIADFLRARVERAEIRLFTADGGTARYEPSRAL